MTCSTRSVELTTKQRKLLVEMIHAVLSLRDDSAGNFFEVQKQLKRLSKKSSQFNEIDVLLDPHEELLWDLAMQ